LPKYCEACGVRIGGGGFIDEAKTVVWHGFCKECLEKLSKAYPENENKSVNPFDIAEA
jgi:hypothetical protein